MYKDLVNIKIYGFITKILYLGYDILLIIEIPKYFIEFGKESKILCKDKKSIKIGWNYSEEEVLSFSDNNQIGTGNIYVDMQVIKSAEEYE